MWFSKKQDFQQKYNIDKKIGSGGFSEVFLVTDGEGNHYALKKIDRKENNLELELLQRQIQIMQALQNGVLQARKGKKGNSPTQSSSIIEGSKFVAKILDWEYTDDYINLLLEYCDGGDIRKDMNTQPNFVYTFDEGRKIIADIIRGLEFIHGHGFVHRDIKSENILVKKMSENGRKVYKIGDFGISKDVSTNRTKTVLGTRQYMSPEMLFGKDYRFEVDMWALGVLFYYMLNMAYPFNLNPMMDDFKELSNNLIKQSTKFSYKQSVNKCKSKKKQLGTCTEDMQNLFERIFQPNAEKRLTFIEIRSHPVFRDLFKNDKMNLLVKIYKENYQKKLETIKYLSPRLFSKVERPTATFVQHQKQITALRNKNSEIQILLYMHHQVRKISVLSQLEKLPLSYNLIKFYLIRQQKFLKAIETKEISQHYPELKMKKFFSSRTFQKLLDRIREFIPTAQSWAMQLQSLCNEHQKGIIKINKDFEKNISDQTPVNEYYKLNFDGPFKSSYRQSTSHAYQILKKQYDREPTQKNIYLITMILICHYFNRIFSHSEKTEFIFESFLAPTKTKPKDIDFDKLKGWLLDAPQEILDVVSLRILEAYEK